MSFKPRFQLKLLRLFYSYYKAELDVGPVAII